MAEQQETPEFYIREARIKIANMMVKRNEYRQSLIDNIIRAQEDIRVNEGLLKSANAELEAMQAALEMMPLGIPGEG